MCEHAFVVVNKNKTISKLKSEHYPKSKSKSKYQIARIEKKVVNPFGLQVFYLEEKTGFTPMDA